MVGPYRPWSTAVHDGGNEAAVIDDLTAFLDQHLRTVEFLMDRCDWDLLIFDLMATDRLGHELWHVWDLTHRAAQGREQELAALRPNSSSSGRRSTGAWGPSRSCRPTRRSCS